MLSWSAGARVATRALALLAERHPGDDLEALRKHYRIGTAYFAAGDVPDHEFVASVETIHGLVDQLVVTQAAHDEALEMGRRLMRGGMRIGQKGSDLDAAELALLLSLERLEVVDVSEGADTRGFDISGHRYWFDHPWASTDVLLSIGSSLEPAQRGLVAGEFDVLWTLPPDYPDRLRSLLDDARIGHWGHLED